MTTKERLHKLVDELSEQEAQHALIVVEDEREAAAERRKRPAVPDALRCFDSGREQPDWVSAVRRSRSEH